MKTLWITASAAVFCVVGSAATAASYAYDFKEAANVGGSVGEKGFVTFDTDSAFVGPNLQITAGLDAGGDDDEAIQHVYFDAGNAGMGVCKDLDAALQCDPGWDDGLTTTEELLIFQATESAMRIEAIYINSNHDPDPIFDTIWRVAGPDGTMDFDTSQAATDPRISQASLSGTGDYRYVLNLTLELGEFFTLHGLRGPNSYVSGIVVSEVPIPATGLLLAGGLAGLATMRRRRKS